jgi:RimJ/RimL family protein N-acetyltransferase
MAKRPLDQRVIIRDIELSDLPAMANYWHRSPPGFLESMGVDPRRIRPERELIATVTAKVEENRGRAASKLDTLVITLDGCPVGSHSVGELVEGVSAVMHAHFWDPSCRGQGLGTYTYPRACRIFFERFALKEIVFKTPQANAAAIRIKTKLGIACVGQEVLNYPFMFPNIVANVYRLSRHQLDLLEDGS